MPHGQQYFPFVLFIFVYSDTSAHQFTCPLSNDRQGECVRLRDCEPYWNVFQNNLLDNFTREYLKTTGLCKLEGSNPIVCCEMDATKCITPENKPGACMQLNRCDPLMKYMVTHDETSDYLNQSKCEHPDKEDRICCPIFLHPITGQIKPKFLTPGDGEGFCGINVYDDKLIGGNISRIYQNSWAVLLKYGNGEYSCGGSLIHQKYILTAAHCVTGPRIDALKNVVAVRLGEHNLETYMDCEYDLVECNEPPVDIEVDEIVHHPEFSLEEHKNDIALIRLKKPAPYMDHVRPICLPTNIPEKTYQILTGWDRSPNGYHPDEKLSLRFPFYSNEECEKKYGIKLDDTQFCAGEKNDQYLCGIGGSPLIYSEIEQKIGLVFYQTGIASYWPKNCETTKTPHIFTNVSRYTKWIQDNIYV